MFKLRNRLYSYALVGDILAIFGNRNNEGEALIQKKMYYRVLMQGRLMRTLLHCVYRQLFIIRGFN